MCCTHEKILTDYKSLHNLNCVHTWWLSYGRKNDDALQSITHRRVLDEDDNKQSSKLTFPIYFMKQQYLPGRSVGVTKTWQGMFVYITIFLSLKFNIPYRNPIWQSRFVLLWLCWITNYNIIVEYFVNS